MRWRIVGIHARIETAFDVSYFPAPLRCVLYAPGLSVSPVGAEFDYRDKPTHIVDAAKGLTTSGRSC